MNNKKYFSSLLCITLLTFAPACNKKKAQSTPKTTQQDTQKMIDLDNTIFEVEETDTDQKAIKF